MPLSTCRWGEAPPQPRGCCPCSQRREQPWHRVRSNSKLNSEIQEIQFVRLLVLSHPRLVREPAFGFGSASLHSLCPFPKTPQGGALILSGNPSHACSLGGGTSGALLLSRGATCCTAPYHLRSVSATTAAGLLPCRDRPRGLQQAMTSRSSSGHESSTESGPPQIFTRDPGL